MHTAEKTFGAVAWRARITRHATVPVVFSGYTSDFCNTSDATSVPAFLITFCQNWHLLWTLPAAFPGPVLGRTSERDLFVSSIDHSQDSSPTLHDGALFAWKGSM